MSNSTTIPVQPIIETIPLTAAQLLAQSYLQPSEVIAVPYFPPDFYQATLASDETPQIIANDVGTFVLSGPRDGPWKGRYVRSHNYICKDLVPDQDYENDGCWQQVSSDPESPQDTYHLLPIASELGTTNMIMGDDETLWYGNLYSGMTSTICTSNNPLCSISSDNSRSLILPGSLWATQGQDPAPNSWKFFYKQAIPEVPINANRLVSYGELMSQIVEPTIVYYGASTDDGEPVGPFFKQIIKDSTSKCDETVFGSMILNTSTDEASKPTDKNMHCWISGTLDDPNNRPSPTHAQDAESYNSQPSLSDNTDKHHKTWMWMWILIGLGIALFFGGFIWMMIVIAKRRQ
jgi:hypothetical protein